MARALVLRARAGAGAHARVRAREGNPKIWVRIRPLFIGGTNVALSPAGNSAKHRPKYGKTGLALSPAGSSAKHMPKIRKTP